MRKTALLASLVLINLTPARAGAATEIPANCKKLVPVALEVGFKRRDLPELFRIANRESRCIPWNKGFNKRADGTVWSTDWGVMQLNDYSWLRYLRDRNIIKVKEDLLNPRINLRAALALVKYSTERGLPKWYQWRTSNPNGSANGANNG